MAAIKGRGIVWSTGEFTFAGAIVSDPAAGFPQSMRLARTVESTKIKDNQGPVRAIVYHGNMATLSLTVIISALTDVDNTIAKARASGDALTPAAGGTVTITDDSGAVVGGPYNLLSATQNRSVDGAATVDLELEKGDEGIDTTTLIS